MRTQPGSSPLGFVRFRGVVDALRMVARLQRCLALRAVVARGLRRRLVAFGFDDAPVLHGHPNAAFHLAAATAARADALDLGRLGLRNLVLGERGSVACSADGRCGGGCSRQFRERATCHSQLPHESSSLFVCVPGERWVGDAPCAMMYRTLRRWRSACRAPLATAPSGIGFPQPDGSSMPAFAGAHIMH